jgi:hypothetical protein
MCAVLFQIEICGYWVKEIPCGIWEGTTKENVPTTSVADCSMRLVEFVKEKVPLNGQSLQLM